LEKVSKVDRKTNISVWQLRLFEGFDLKIMVMQRDEQEVFDDAIHVFFNKEYYDSYVAKAVRYSNHRYAYHEDKLGEVINQVFEENIKGIVLHISTNEGENKQILNDERYISAKDLMGIKDAADSYHYLYTTSIDRCDSMDAIARIWTKYVYVIGQLPDPRVKPKEGENQVYQLMTIKRKKNGKPASAEDYDYESLQVFLTFDSAMRFNPDKKPVNKYRLSLLAQIVKGKLRISIEPHRSYNLEFDPAKIDLRGHLELPKFDESMVKDKIVSFTKLEKVYIALAPNHCDYMLKKGNPLLVRADEKNIIMYLFEKYSDAQEYCLQNSNLLPILGGTYPIGVVENLEEIMCIAEKLGVTVVSLDTDTLKAVGCKIDYFKNVAGYNREIEDVVASEELEKVMRVVDGNKQYRMPLINFYDQENEYDVSETRKLELFAHIDNDNDNGYSFMAGLTTAEMIVMVREVSVRFDNARKENNEEDKIKYNHLMNLFTVPLTESLCEKPYIYALRDEKGDFVLKNNIIYLILTNRYEAGRKGEGRLVPASIDNAGFMDKLVEAGSVVAVTDGPSLLCLLDTKLMRDVALQWKRSEPFREEFMIYMTQGLGKSFPEAMYYYKRLKSDSSIFDEFRQTVREGRFPEVGMLNIEGYTAKTIARENGLEFIDAYDILLSIKNDKEYLAKYKASNKEASDNGASDENTSNEGTSSQDKDEKKGLFGKIFKK
jgi:hypothetical protein